MVPKISAGRISGVNWILENLAFTACDNVFAASVLASPGIPSNKIWLLPSKPITSFSRSFSWPIMVCFIIPSKSSKRPLSFSISASKFFQSFSLLFGVIFS